MASDHRGRKLHAGKRDRDLLGRKISQTRVYGMSGEIYDREGFLLGMKAPQEQVDPPEADA